MSQTFSSTKHLISTTGGVGATPLTMAMHFTTGGGQGLNLLTLATAGNNSNEFGMVLDRVSATNKLSGFISNSSTGFSTQVTGAVVDATGNYNHGIFRVSSNSSRDVYLNGSNKISATGTLVSPTSVVATIVSGRPSDFSGGIGGQAAHAAVWSRALSDAECSYIGGGGNPRAIKGTTSYWKITPAEVTSGTVIDQIGSNNLTVSSATNGTTDPNIETFMVGGPIGALNYTVGTAITAINLAAGAGIFDDVASAFTVSLCQLNTPTSPTTTTSALSAVREIPVASVTGLVKNSYVKIAGSGNPYTRILAINVTALTIVVDQDCTFTTSATVSYYTVNPLSIPGLSFTGASYGGTPTSAVVNNLSFFRATCTGNTALVADTDINTYTVTGGGGGGSSLLNIAGSFSGGFSGG
jgi:hypothetical protein